MTTKGPHAHHWEAPGSDPRPLAVEPAHDYTSSSEVPPVLTCYCQVCGHGVSAITRYMRRHYIDDPMEGPESAETRLVGAKLDPCGHYVREYFLQAVVPAP